MPRPSAASTRQRLLAAAAALFAARGYRGASVRAICAHAGIANLAAIAYYYRDKERLFAAVAALPARRLAASIAEFSDPGLPLSAALVRLYRAMLAPLAAGSVEAAAMGAIARCLGEGRRLPRRAMSDVQRHRRAVEALVSRQVPGIGKASCALAADALIALAMQQIARRYHPCRERRQPAVRDVEPLAQRLAGYAAAIIAYERRSCRASRSAALSHPRNRDR
ncbi:MAG: TetR/AcrR family transcriptional regulator [Planctomycetota bacterium]|nr:TetR/AcrR family transcriptional regulator [Planctomycetota bacterium]